MRKAKQKHDYLKKTIKVENADLSLKWSQLVAFLPWNFLCNYCSRFLSKQKHVDQNFSQKLTKK